MGMTTFIYGSIQEYGLNSIRTNEIYLHNENILRNLPVNDTWPPLAKNMSSITKNLYEESSPNYEYLEGLFILEDALSRLNMNGLIGKTNSKICFVNFIG